MGHSYIGHNYMGHNYIPAETPRRLYTRLGSAHAAITIEAITMWADNHTGYNYMGHGNLETCRKPPRLYTRTGTVHEVSTSEVVRLLCGP